MPNRKADILRRVLPPLLLFAVLWLLALLFPLTGDDWQWGTAQGISKLNGRYLGNFFAALLSRNAWLRPLVKSLAFTIIALGCAGADKDRRKLPVAALLLMLMPLTMFRQSLVWTSGFSNYVLPAALLTPAFVLYMRLPRLCGLRKGLAAAACLLPVFASQLFAEHITLYVLLLTIAGAVFRLRQYGKLSWAEPIIALSAIAGAALMFTNAAYGAGGTAGAHKMPGLEQLFTNLTSNYKLIIAPYMLRQNRFLNIFLSALFVYILWKVEGGRFRRCFARVLSVYPMLYCFYMLLRFIHPILPLRAWMERADAAADGLYFAVLVCASFFLPKAPRAKLLFAFGSVLVLTAPLLVLSPIGPRCFFVCHVFFVYAAVTLWEQVTEGAERAEAVRFARHGIAAGFALVWLLYMAIYGDISLADRARDRSVRRQYDEGAEQISVSWLPYRDYVWSDSLEVPYLQTQFKRFHGIPEEIPLIVVP